MTNSIKLPIWYISLTLIAAFLGFLDATYLTIVHYGEGMVPCSLTEGCERVLNSPYAVVGGLPVALLGVVYYLVLLILSGIYLQKENDRVRTALLILPVFGFGGSVGLVFVQAVLLQAFCTYCLFSALLSTLLFGASLAVRRISRSSP